MVVLVDGAGRRGVTTPEGLIDPSQFPFRSAEMDVQGLERAAQTLRRLGSGVAEGADELVSTWAGLQGAYEGPADERVHGLMAPVSASADWLKADLSTAADHLEEFSETLGALRVKLMALEQEAQAFRDSVAMGVKVHASDAAAAVLVATGWVIVPWDQDTDTAKRNKQLLLDHAKLVEDISTASATCHNALMDLVPGSDDGDDIAPVYAEQLMDRTQAYPWGMPVDEDRNWAESIDHGAYSFGFNLYAGLAALACGYDAEMGERSNEHWWQAVWGAGNAIGSLGVTGASSYLFGTNPAAANWVYSHLPDGARAWLTDRYQVAAGTGGSLVGIDVQEHLAGGDGFWRWREDAVATGTESVLNIGTMFVPAGGVGTGALKTGSLGARIVRIATGGLDFVVPGGSLAVQTTIRAAEGLRGAVLRLDEFHPVLPNPASAVDGGPSVSVVDDPHVHVLADSDVSSEFFGDGFPGHGDTSPGSDPADAPADGLADGSSEPAPPDPSVDRSDFATTVAQTQGRHVAGSSMYEGVGSYFTDGRDAQAVLDAFHDGSAEILGFKANGDVVVRVEAVTGFNMNGRYQIVDQPTNVFFIKGTVHPSVVPYNPLWAPR